MKYKDLQSFGQLSISSDAKDGKYTFQRPYPQEFSISYPILKYMITYPTGKAWKKLIQTCKYFFSKKPIYPVNRCITFKGTNSKIDDVVEVKKIVSKVLWLHNFFYAFKDNISSFIAPRTLKSELRCLRLDNQNLLFDDYQTLTASGNFDTLCLIRNRIAHSDGSYAKLDELLQNIQQIENFYMICHNGFSIFDENTVKNIVRILPRFTKLQEFDLFNLTEAFDIHSITDYIIQNDVICFCLYYNETLHLTPGYRTILENCIDKILSNPPKKFPYFSFFGFNGARYERYQKYYRW